MRHGCAAGVFVCPLCAPQYPHKALIVAGTQADSASKNQLHVIKVTDMRKTLNDSGTCVGVKGFVATRLLQCFLIGMTSLLARWRRFGGG